MSNKVELPRGFVEFALEAMTKAVHLRRDGVTQELAKVSLNAYSVDNIETAALALLASVEDGEVIEAPATAVKSIVLPGEGETVALEKPEWKQ